MDIGSIIIQLSRWGYRFWLDGNDICYRYDDPGEPDLPQVEPLFEELKRRKNEALFFLRCFCPKCGGIVFADFGTGESTCVACSYAAVKRLPGALTH